MVTYENKGFRFLPKNLIIFTLKFFDRISLFFVQLKINPNHLSLAGLLAGLLVGLFYALALPVWALVFLLISGMMDILDGKVATNGNRKTRFGAVFDSSLDRYSEFAIYFGLGYYFRHHWVLWVIALAFLGSTMVSYTKARAEGLGIQCQMGIMQRAERLVLLILGTLIGLIIRRFDQAMIITIIILTFASNLTAIQRIIFVYKQERQEGNKS
ncbi:MAG TPA: CDP-alcohol phosphatidyltransferase family protein [Candidatus Saccharicenans sp.]|mgnify:CR=1 FL=1|jgi:CDP-diacylglycerol--glycerol-3-phosphate 3-phosphatidyltransferase|nr:CDP-alcohol phosphatidyltransferase family protein [Candidatus Saccharicenans sp.]HRD01700.1 CDP-alcohol phosphatidyltransferase family protein [Candidatus Saccharicenans sp.]